MGTISKDKPPDSIWRSIFDGGDSLGKVKQCIRRGDDVNSIVSNTGETNFNWVMKWPCGKLARPKYIEIAEVLLNSGAKIVGSKVGDTREPALHHCVNEGNVLYVEFLLKNGSPVDEKYDGRTPLHVALKSHDGEPAKLMECIHLLVVDYKANVNATTDKARRIPPCFWKGDAGDISRYWDGYLRHGELTALHMSVWACDCKISRFLLENGADVNAKDELGHTPLHLAAMPRNTDNGMDSIMEMLALLFEYNASPFEKNVVEETALDIAEFNIPEPAGEPRRKGNRWILYNKPHNETNGLMIISCIRAEQERIVTLEQEKKRVFRLGHIPRLPDKYGKSSRIQELEERLVGYILHKIKDSRTLHPVDN
ncbi:ankyrin repeat-containing domain protein [Baffinella frigidus]|nr:ankyrin repeat-containing domain protein [Cryptophyta sp. CCMP2293]